MIFGLTQVWATNFENPVDSVCSVTITQVQGGLCLQANATGTAPFSYIWDNGDTGQILCANNPSGGGVYCVTMTDANGCVATACGQLDPNGSNCDVWISQDSLMNSGIELTAQPTGSAPFSYSWSTNELTQSITVTQPGIYCVTITDDSGCETSSCITIEENNNTNCWVTIQSVPAGALIAVAGGTAPYTYAWSTNENTESILPTVTGYYCVTITDDTGCEASDCYFYYDGGNNDTTCYLTVSQVQGGLCLEATGYGTAPFTFIWENGDTGSTYCPGNPNGGTYCVAMVDANGCASTACGTLGNGGQDSCYVYIQETNSGDLYASSNPNSGIPVAYLWSTGETTQSITPDNEGTYCVTITTATGCTAEDCIDFDFTGDISGLIWMHDSNNDSLSLNSYGTAYLIKYDPVEGSLTAVNQTLFHSGELEFNNVEAGEYLIKVALSPNTMSYENNLPTYFGNELWWNEATTLDVQENTSYTIEIEMVEGDNPGGPGFIGGLVSEGANFSGGDDSRGDGDPLENVSMILLDENDNPISYTFTNVDGEYKFDDLAWGTYKVFIEIPGIEQVMYLVTISPENPSVENLDFLVDDDSAATVSIKDLLEENSVEIYPNPVSDKLHLQLLAKERSAVIFSLMSVDGKILFEESVELQPGIYSHSFEVNKLPAGLYFINIIDGKETISRKVIKK